MLKRIVNEYNNLKFQPSKIICDVKTFTDMVNGGTRISPPNVDDILRANYYGKVEIDGNIIDLYIKKDITGFLFE